MKRPGIVIVTSNSEAAIGPCLDSLAGSAADVVVIDNASADGTVDEVRRRPGVTLIANTDNRGFAGGVNQGFEALANEVILLLNPDAILATPLDALVAAFADETVGAAAGKLIGSDGAAQAGFNVRRFPTPAALTFECLGLNRVWPSNPVNRRYRCADFDPDRETDVEQPAGAFLMVRRSAWQQLGGFDQRFHPVWFEDVDFLFRMRRTGLRVRYIPSATARHAGGHSVGRLPEGCRQLYWYASLLRYASKSFALGGRKLVCVAVIFGSLLRMLTGVLRERKRTPIVVYGTVIRLAVHSLFTGRVRGAGRFAAAGTTQ